MRLTVTSQQWQNTIAQEHQVHVLFALTFGKLVQRSDETSAGWTGGQKKDLEVNVTVRQSHLGLKILGEARTKAFKISTIRPGVSGTPLKEPH